MSEEKETETGNSYIDSSVGKGSTPVFRLKFIDLLSDEGMERTNLSKSSNLEGNVNLETSLSERTNSDYEYEKLSKKNKEIIKSNIDGGTDYTNIQDKNSGDWSNFGSIIGGTVTNSLGITNTDISNIGSIVNDIIALADPSKAKVNSFDESMSKINEWKGKVYKDLHPFDWKPGQTIPQDLMDSSAGSLANDLIEMFGNKKFKKGYRKAKNYISPDPIKYVRNSIKSSKGIDPNEEDFRIKSEEIELYKNNNDYGDNVSNNRFSGYNRSKEETKFINALKNKNTFNKDLGYIYIKPKYNYNEKEGMMNIPFEFNPEISGDGNQATYISETLLNRIGTFQVYTGTNPSQLSVVLKYMALSPDFTDEKDIAKQFSTDIWQYYWTNSRIESIEYQLRSLVFPDVTSSDYLIRPPLIEIHLGNNSNDLESVGDLYKYPIGLNSGNDSGDDNYLAVTKSINGSVNRYKKYIVTNVQIDPLSEDSFMWPSYYGRVWDKNKSGSPINHIKTAKNFEDENNYLLKEEKIFTNTRRTGFRATLQLIEVTENFLDIVPDFRAYYNAWTTKSENANVSYENSSYLLGGENVSEDALSTSLITGAQNIEKNKEELKDFFIEAYKLASLYKDINKSGSSIKNFNDAKFNEKSSKDKYYYANKKWFYDENKKVNNDEKLDPEKDPIFFNVLLKGDFDRFINSESTLPSSDDGNKNIVYTKNYKDEELTNKDIGMPKKSINLSPEDFCIDDTHLDYLNLFAPLTENNPEDSDVTGYDKNGKLSYIFQQTSNVNKYTDAECFFLIKRMIDLSNKIKEDLGPSGNAEEEMENLLNDEKNIITNLYLNIIYSIKNRSVITNENIKDIKGNIYISFNKDISIKNENIEINKACSDFLKNIYDNNILNDDVRKALLLNEYNSKKAETTNYLINEINFVRSCDAILETKLESTLYLEPTIYGIEEILKLDLDSYIKNNSCFDSFVNCLENESDKIDYFNKFFTYLNDIENQIKNMSLDKKKKFNDMKKYFEKIEKRCNNCLKIVKESIDIISNIIFDNEYSYKKAMFDAGDYLRKSILCGDNVKCIKKIEKNRKVLFNYYSNGKNHDFNSEKYTSNQKEYIYETYIKDKGITILNVRKIVDAMIEGFEKALNELEPIDKKMKNIKEAGIKIDKEENIPSIDSILFIKDNETYFGNEKDKEENLDNYIETLKKDLQQNFGLDIEEDSTNSESAIDAGNIQKLLNFIIYIKEYLNNENIAKYFYKVTGFPKDNEKGVVSLEKIENKYKDYSKNEGYIRQNVFEEWDKVQTYSSANSLVTNKRFADTFKTDENGKIPNMYCKILERETNIKSLKIASNNIQDYNRLNKESKKTETNTKIIASDYKFV